MAPPTGERITVGEVGRRLDRLEDRLDERFAGIHRRLDELNVVSPAVYDADQRTTETKVHGLMERVTHLEAANQWLWRTVAGSAILIVIGLIVTAAGLHS